MLEGILAVEEEHADELHLLVAFPEVRRAHPPLPSQNERAP
jgi:hypothetical protein